MKQRVGGKVDGPESGRSVESGRSFDGKWTVLQKVDGLLTKSGRSRGKVDGLLTKSGRSLRKWTVRLKVDGPSESGRSV